MINSLDPQASAARWGAVVAMSLCAAVLVASEFMPVSLLTPLATDLAISEGQAGQSISISGLFAVLTSLAISPLMGTADRRHVLLFFTALLGVSGVMVAFAPNAGWLMAGRAILGVAVGGYWSISAAIVMRLVPADGVAKALAILNGGNAAATVVSAPLGSYLGSIIGWRGAFFCVVPVAVVTLIWQWRALPKLPAPQAANGAAIWAVFGLFRKPVFAVGMGAVGLLFMGQFMLFTYLRPYLDIVTGQDAKLISGMLLIMGLAGVAGTIWIGNALKSHMYSLLIWFPVLMAVTAIALMFSTHSPLITAALLAVWGFLGTSAPVAWWTWMARTVPEDTERAGGLLVAVIQLAIALGAVLGGIIFDRWGFPSTFACAGLVLIGSAIMGWASKVMRP